MVAAIPSTAASATATDLRYLSADRQDEGEITMLLATALYRSDQPIEAAARCQQGIADGQGQGVEARRLQDLQHAILTDQAADRGPLGW